MSTLTTPVASTTPDHCFTDSLGRKWDVSLNLAAARRIDAADYSILYTGPKFSILEPTKELFHTLLSSRGLIFAMIYAIVQPQVLENCKIDPKENDDAAQDEFGKGMNGLVIEKGREAFWGSLADFFPEHKTALSLLMIETKRADAKIQKAIAEMAPEMEGLTDSLIDVAIAKMGKELQSLKTPVPATGEK